MTRSHAGLQLSPGSRVAIVGGGPAGSFAALHLLRFAHQLSLPLTVTVFERKDFRRRGPAGCNKCAGILSSRAVRGLQELGLQIPERLVMARLEGYVLHLAGHAIPIARPEPGRAIISVYRGGGPLRANLAQDVSFDAWLLDEACAAGAEVATANVRKISAGPRMEVQTDAGQEDFDLVFLASGVNAHPPVLEGLAYRPPRTEVMAQDELALEKPLTLTQRTQAQVHVGQQAGLTFGALIPKGDLLNVSLLGHGLSGDPVSDFLQRADCQWLDAAGRRRLCGCRPRIAVAPAQRPFADRFVAVGDAAVTRLYKDGIGSALVTARQAAWTALHAGIAQTAFARHYGPLYRSIAWDNRIGQLLFWPWQGRESWLYRLWEQGWRHVLEAEQALPVHRRYGHLALWSMLTGDDSYARIARRALHPAIIGALLWSPFAGGWSWSGGDTVTG
ncbi:MAG: hypothetical protein AUK03_14140 [Anaerolineae bacterium CG2_30_64_16]|nr:MAG: hypothetical protein AUK03_14140 [Anaerolineae bacterium CG2_30_64_16]